MWNYLPWNTNFKDILSQLHCDRNSLFGLVTLSILNLNLGSVANVGWNADSWHGRFFIICCIIQYYNDCTWYLIHCVLSVLVRQSKAPNRHYVSPAGTNDISTCHWTCALVFLLKMTKLLILHYTFSATSLTSIMAYSENVFICYI
jgi:hypothetical protein